MYILHVDNVEILVFHFSVQFLYLLMYNEHTLVGRNFVPMVPHMG